VFTMHVNQLQKSFQMYYKYTPDTDLVLNKIDKKDRLNVITTTEEQYVIGQETIDLKDFAKNLMKNKSVAINPSNNSQIKSMKLNVLVQFTEDVEFKVSKAAQLKNLEK